MYIRVGVDDVELNQNITFEYLESVFLVDIYICLSIFPSLKLYNRIPIQSYMYKYSYLCDTSRRFKKVSCIEKCVMSKLVVFIFA